MPVLTVLRLGFSSLLMVVFAIGFLTARDWPTQAAIYPLAVTAAGFLLAFVTFFSDFRRWRREGDAIGDDASSTASTAVYDISSGGPGYAFARAARYGAWMLVYMAMMRLIGLVAAAGVFVTAFLLIEAKVRLRWVWIGPLATIALLLTLSNAVNLFWPQATFQLID